MVGKAEAARLAHICLPWRARLLIQVEDFAFHLNRWAEAHLWSMDLERVSRRGEKPAWRGKLVRRGDRK
jgi:hypothetical protein